VGAWALGIVLAFRMRSRLADLQCPQWVEKQLLGIGR